MTNPGYLDTSAIMRWIEGDVQSPTPINASIAPKVDVLIKSKQRLGLSELTLMEFRANVAKNWRNPGPQFAEFDAAWAERSRTRVMNLLASGRVEEVVAPSHAAEHAAMLADLAARDHEIPLGTWDTVHLITAAAWAQAELTKVDLFTSDPDYGEYLAIYTQFTRLVLICDLSI